MDKALRRLLTDEDLTCRLHQAPKEHFTASVAAEVSAD